MPAQKPFLDLLLFWMPLAAQWILMAFESPTVAAFIARMPDQKLNLAAHGVAFSLGLLVEAPIMMMLSASNAIVSGRVSFRRLRSFNLTLCAILTLVMVLLQVPWVFALVAKGLHLTEEMAMRTRIASAFLIPWPAAIGIRRFYHGILINAGSTGILAWGMLLRLVTLIGVGAALYLSGAVPGYCVGTAAIAVGVVVEMFFAWFCARGQVRAVMAREDTGKVLSMRETAAYYLPLALTSVIALAINPMVTLFVGRFAFPIESLAVLPLVTNLVFLFGCPAISFQEVLITWFAKRPEEKPLLRRVAVGLGVLSTLFVVVAALTPLRDLWFGGVTGLREPLLGFVAIPLLVLAFQAGSNAWLVWVRAHLILSRRTKPITHSALVEIAALALVFLALVGTVPSLTGAVAAATALALGRVASLGFLLVRERMALGAGSLGPGPR